MIKNTPMDAFYAPYSLYFKRINCKETQNKSLSSITRSKMWLTMPN